MALAKKCGYTNRTQTQTCALQSGVKPRQPNGPLRVLVHALTNTVRGRCITLPRYSRGAGPLAKHKHKLSQAKADVWSPYSVGARPEVHHGSEVFKRQLGLGNLVRGRVAGAHEQDLLCVHLHLSQQQKDKRGYVGNKDKEAYTMRRQGTKHDDRRQGRM